MSLCHAGAPPLGPSRLQVKLQQGEAQVCCAFSPLAAISCSSFPSIVQNHASRVVFVPPTPSCYTRTGSSGQAHALGRYASCSSNLPITVKGGPQGPQRGRWVTAVPGKLRRCLHRKGGLHRPLCSYHLTGGFGGRSVGDGTRMPWAANGKRGKGQHPGHE